jgi:DNA-binding response OmpR family regulator
MIICKRLLSVDDDPAILRMIGQLAKDLGFMVQCISRSDLFPKVYHELDPTVVTLDLSMPAVDGIELLLWLADNRFSGHVIIISGWDTRYLPMAEELGRQRGMIKITQLAKPFLMDALRVALLA